MRRRLARSLLFYNSIVTSGWLGIATKYSKHPDVCSSPFSVILIDQGNATRYRTVSGVKNKTNDCMNMFCSTRAFRMPRVILFSSSFIFYKKWLENLIFALWLNSLSSHFTRHLPPNGMTGFLPISMERTSSEARKIVRTRLLFTFNIRAVCFLLCSIDHRQISSNNSPREILGNLAKKLSVLILRFFLQSATSPARTASEIRLLVLSFPD